MTTLWTYLTSRNARVLHGYHQKAHKVLEFIKQWQHWDDQQLRHHSQILRQRIEDGQTLGSVTLEALALAAVAAHRTLGLMPYPVQLVGALTLLDRQIAEMRTGEGKTLTAALAAFVRSLEGKGVHVVTANDYLAQRDAATVTPMFELLGRSVGVVFGRQTEGKREAYLQDVTYGTSNEIGFDYLRDNLATTKDAQFMRGLYCAIVDEVDSILIDEARVPLIISGPTNDSVAPIMTINTFIGVLTESPTEDNENDFYIDWKTKRVVMGDRGFETAERLLVEHGLLKEEDNLYAPQNTMLVAQLHAALRAHHVFQRDVDYIVRDNKIMIVDERTGRVSPGRRWGEGLHQALEAKENLKVEQDDQTLAAVSLQNLFRAYAHLSGMTGTAATEQEEFHDIYGLEVIVIPTHLPMIRQDKNDLVFLTEQAKIGRMIEEVQLRHAQGQPILLGTSSIQMTEEISRRLTERHIAHEVLNAKNHEREAHIIAEAGTKGAVTIATNMAGRGTDIVLGGSKEHLQTLHPDWSDEQVHQHWQDQHNEVVQLGGLHVIGSERHESRRVDNQLRGRAGRQGDPGSSQFFVSFEDKLLKIFAPGWATKMLGNMGMKEGDSIDMPMVGKQIERAQKTVERHHFSARKSVFDYDDVVNTHRILMYTWRQELLDGNTEENFESNFIVGSILEHLETSLHDHGAPDEEQWQDMVKDLWMEPALAAHLFSCIATLEPWSQQAALHVLQQELHQWWADVGRHIPQANEWGRQIILAAHDLHWKDHLHLLDVLRDAVRFRQYAQKKPLEEYGREALVLYKDTIANAHRDAVRGVMRMIVTPTPEMAQAMAQAG